MLKNNLYSKCKALLFHIVFNDIDEVSYYYRTLNDEEASVVSLSFTFAFVVEVDQIS